ncbi:hypothetical protein OKA04_01090 [Luteolibacter flavescens]|uniref:CvpA family protein n=1 Tax=Luteolibacter flavescens TaxID=1859460 RepID=A0ABT3FIA5_9BACT|nr:hypothetical protein [Luteolibacter flavescens]MCW1883303.1 hypothetical protein [Luteolibacter flavescens]
MLAALNLESMPQLSLGTAALLVFAACAVFAILRGLVKMITGSLVLCLSGVAAYLAWRHAPVIPIPGGPWIAPITAGLLSLFVLRAVLRFVASPFSKSGDDDGEPKKRSPLRWALTLLTSLVPASLLSFTGVTALKNVGAVADIQRFVDGEKANSGSSAFLAEVKEVINRVLPEDWFRNIDPLTEDARVNLAKLIARGDSKPPPKAIPVMEDPEIRSLILHDPKLRELAKSKRYADILRDPRLDHVMANPDLKKLLGNLQL